MNIGFTPNALTEFVPQALAEIQRLMPSVQITLSEGTSLEHLSRIPRGEVDIAFMPDPPERPRGIEVRPIATHQTLVAIPDTFPLAEVEPLTLSDLQGVPLIFVPDTVPTKHRTQLLDSMEKLGFVPNVAQEALFDHTRLRMVAAGLGVAFVSEMAAPNGFPNVVFRRLEDLEIDVAFCIVRKSAAAPAVRRLFDTLYQTLKLRSAA